MESKDNEMRYVIFNGIRRDDWFHDVIIDRCVLQQNNYNC